MSSNIKVVIRVRPLIEREKKEKHHEQWEVKDNSIYPIDSAGKRIGDAYYFDHIFGKTCSNDDIYNTAVHPIVEQAMSGFNGTVFAYGQTSAGKTRTMMGNDTEAGIISLTVKNIFSEIERSVNKNFLLRISYMEIYNEKIYDLLNSRQQLKISEDVHGYVKVNVKEVVTESKEKIYEMMKKGDKEKRTGDTKMSEKSSRSHTIFRIIIESSDIDDTGVVNVAHLNLVDLAGSERATQTKATGQRLKEGANINKSLSTLSLVMKQLSESQDYVNFRDSKLTRILQSSLGGNALTTIICAITPAALEESHSTLAFASRAKTVRNQPSMNEVVTEEALINRYRNEIDRLTRENKDLQGNLQEAKRIKMLEMKILFSKTRDDININSSCTKHRRMTWSASHDALPVIYESEVLKIDRPDPSTSSKTLDPSKATIIISDDDTDPSKSISLSSSGDILQLGTSSSVTGLDFTPLQYDHGGGAKKVETTSIRIEDPFETPECELRDRIKLLESENKSLKELTSQQTKKHTCEMDKIRTLKRELFNEKQRKKKLDSKESGMSDTSGWTNYTLKTEARPEESLTPPRSEESMNWLIYSSETPQCVLRKRIEYSENDYKSTNELLTNELRLGMEEINELKDKVKKLNSALHEEKIKKQEQENQFLSNEQRLKISLDEFKKKCTALYKRNESLEKENRERNDCEYLLEMYKKKFATRENELLESLEESRALAQSKTVSSGDEQKLEFPVSEAVCEFLNKLKKQLNILKSEVESDRPLTVVQNLFNTLKIDEISSKCLDWKELQIVLNVFQDIFNLISIIFSNDTAVMELLQEKYQLQSANAFYHNKEKTYNKLVTIQDQGILLLSENLKKYENELSSYKNAFKFLHTDESKNIEDSNVDKISTTVKVHKNTQTNEEISALLAPKDTKILKLSNESSAIDQVSVLRNTIEEYKEKLKRKDCEIDEYIKRIKEFDSVQSMEQELKAKLEAELKKYKTLHASSDKENVELSDKIMEYLDEVTLLEKEVKELKLNLKAKEELRNSELTKTEEEIASIKTKCIEKVVELNNSLRSRDVEICALNLKLDEMKDEYMNRISILEDEIRIKDKVINSKDSELNDKSLTISKYIVEMKKLKAEYNFISTSRSEAINNAQTSINEYQNEIKCLKIEVQMLNKKLSEYNKECDSQVKIIDELNSQLIEKCEIVSHKENEINNLRRIINQHSQEMEKIKNNLLDNAADEWANKLLEEKNKSSYLLTKIDTLEQKLVLLNEKDEQLITKQSEISKLLSDLERAKANVSRYEISNEKLVKKNLRIKQTYEIRCKETFKKLAELHKKNDEYSKAVEELAIANSKLQENEKEIEALKVQLQTEKEIQKSLQSQLAISKQELDKKIFDTEHNTLDPSSKIRNLEETIARLTKIIDGNQDQYQKKYEESDKKCRKSMEHLKKLINANKELVTKNSQTEILLKDAHAKILSLEQEKEISSQTLQMLQDTVEDQKLKLHELKRKDKEKSARLERQSLHDSSRTFSGDEQSNICDDGPSSVPERSHIDSIKQLEEQLNASRQQLEDLDRNYRDVSRKNVELANLCRLRKQKIQELEKKCQN